ncbi:hypothetical protein M422DRAFT_28543 [Sphaerobolus stellatus SS14]|uniref:Lysophospholipase n=1 Tax=Sphaerobolus stellatus (strain SS14) TaxID=990650 RepID=A0A0C9W5Z9_SPHS4|nr:hypothetical protein M422DRAFT_28543 [Sphaerobolus stellatus SS14]
MRLQLMVVPKPRSQMQPCHLPCEQPDHIQYSLDTFKTSYSQEHQQIFLAQSAASVTSGFMPNSTEADPQFSLCFQCALVERSRTTVPEPANLSTLCNQCFDKYCYNPASPPSKSAIVGRQLAFVDPDLQNEVFLKQHGTQLGIGIAAAVAALIAIVAAFLFWRC